MLNMVRSLGYSSVDMNRFPRLLYYIYQANWVPLLDQAGGSSGAPLEPRLRVHPWHADPGECFQQLSLSSPVDHGVPKDPVTGAVLADQIRIHGTSTLMQI